MEIRVLRYFLTVAREGNITKAANVLHVTQPTLSRQLKDLEQELGKKLFIRSSHSIILTDEGMLLRNRAEEIVNMVDKLEAEFSSMEETIGGDVYIGGGETEAMKHIARVAKDVQLRYPNIRYHLYSGNEEDITERLDKGLLDFGILIQPADISKYNYLNMPAKDVWGVVMRKDSPLALKESIQAADLLNVPLICSRQAMKQTFSKNEFADWFGEDFHKLNIVTTYNLAYNAAIMVEEGVGYAITLDKIVNTSTNSNLCFRPLQPRLESGLNIVWKKHHVLSAAADAFLKELQEEFAQTLN
ncbi:MULTISPECIES: LysR family transcriptional regulator [Priestia]|jgi:DNA-binding transcriptional LysR family regulator|uniref:LysR family transcriptional regulator n=1 Tax=Priestia megaterium TaxID=1404 RepID=A0ABD4WNN2_PRIMG|nr:LysR family transcriptional regulator [Priestia megaterium]KRF57081.1 LysR family transcriptional regulator [Bacillus sp. Soil531]MCF6797621.1 LysR family transcriptional regulator [Bacillus sp. ET1]MBD8843637.1 LysR family transcriptional regulator [Priestia megaterium]MDD9781841.1 LysR family transcriptional regulator [Priestia megaterium]MED3812072.1 LysR family transcriptional regulator [Priestia megaterium]